MRNVLTVMFTLAAVMVAGLMFWTAYEWDLLDLFPRSCDPGGFCVLY